VYNGVRQDFRAPARNSQHAMVGSRQIGYQFFTGNPVLSENDPTMIMMQRGNNFFPIASTAGIRSSSGFKECGIFYLLTER
jgi:hypothetical protein